MDSCYAILAELVKLKTMKDTLDQVEQGNQDQDFVKQYAEYTVRKKKAWQRARDFLLVGQVTNSSQIKREIADYFGYKSFDDMDTRERSVVMRMIEILNIK